MLQDGQYGRGMILCNFSIGKCAYVRWIETLVEDTHRLAEACVKLLLNTRHIKDIQTERRVGAQRIEAPAEQHTLRQDYVYYPHTNAVYSSAHQLLTYDLPCCLQLLGILRVTVFILGCVTQPRGIRPVNSTSDQVH